MRALSRELRQALERAVRKARSAAEEGARKALRSLAIDRREPLDSMTPELRSLRNRLRAHGRQLGDRRDPQTGEQTIDRLARECAYGHWHRMLFARFLAEAGLLIEPETGVAVTLDEAKELAREQGSDWLALASDWAQRMLPQIFRAGDPAHKIALPPETRAALEAILEGLPHEAFLADDSLGWVYQFWQSDQKDAVNESGVKIGADELPAVTQLFTDDYMVLFLLHNTLGAWWAGKALAANPDLAASAKSEDELRAACKAGEVEWTYLRFVREQADDEAHGPWRPAAGDFPGWPKAAKDVTLLDPCMGSGHFLVFALPILAALRMAEEGFSCAAAVDAVLRENLFGLEIDPRCTQIAAFNLAFAAWRMAGHRKLPTLNLACSGLAVGAPKAEWRRLAKEIASAASPATRRDLCGAEGVRLAAEFEMRMENGLAALHDLFGKAPILGSLIDPTHAGGDLFTADFAALEPLLETVLAAAENDETEEMAIAAQGMAKAAEFLGRRFTLVVTNVPFLGRHKQYETMQNWLAAHFGDAKRDLATAMLRRMLGFADMGGTAAAVTPQNWLFLTSYEKLRARLLRETTLNAIVQLGEHGFGSSAAAGAFTALVAITDAMPPCGAAFAGLDANDGVDADAKARAVSHGAVSLLAQATQDKNPDRRISVNEYVAGSLLREYATAYQGISPADLSMFGRRFWEGFDESKFRFWQSTAKETSLFSGKSLVLRCDDFLQEAVDSKRAYVRGAQTWGKMGVSVSQMRELPASLSTGEAFDTNGAVIVPHDPADLPAIWAFCSSPEYHKAVRKLDQKLNVTNDTLAKVPFDIDRWRQVAAKRYPDGLPKPHSDDPTQWLFDGHPARSDAPLQVAVARLLGYLWPRQTGSSFMDCRSLSPDGLERHADRDGIVCLAAVTGEAPAHERLAALLADAFRAEWSAAKLASLLDSAGSTGKTLDDWLRDEFFAQHLKLFHNRPFVWHVWDGRRDGFHALVNYHRLAGPNGEGRNTLEKLIYSCLGDWIDRQNAEVKEETEGADARLAHAEHLRAELVKVHEGAPPYDLFVRWKPLREQPIGWEPDVNDGVRINIRPFMIATHCTPRTVARNTCILRQAPNVKWSKDRGKEPEREKVDYPWFWGRVCDDPAHKVDFLGGAAFDGNRWNDLHYTRACKEAARENHRRDR